MNFIDRYKEAKPLKGIVKVILKDDEEKEIITFDVERFANAEYQGALIKTMGTLEASGLSGIGNNGDTFNLSYNLAIADLLKRHIKAVHCDGLTLKDVPGLIDSMSIEEKVRLVNAYHIALAEDEKQTEKKTTVPSSVKD